MFVLFHLEGPNFQMDFWNLGGGGERLLPFKFWFPQTNATCKFSPTNNGPPIFDLSPRCIPKSQLFVGLAAFFPRDFPYVLPSKFIKIHGNLHRAPGVLPRRCFYDLHCAWQRCKFPRLNKNSWKEFLQNTIEVFCVSILVCISI